MSNLTLQRMLYYKFDVCLRFYLPAAVTAQGDVHSCALLYTGTDGWCQNSWQQQMTCKMTTMWSWSFVSPCRYNTLVLFLMMMR